MLIDRKVVKASMQICVIQSTRYSARNALRSGAEGFTLLEILIVLFIVAVMSGVVVANLPSFARAGDFDTEARRLKTLLDLARLEAQVQTAEFGFKPSHDSYEFLVYDESQAKWQSVMEPPFSPRQLGAKMTLSVKVEDNLLRLGDAASPNKSPPILILSSGEITPFELTLAAADLTTRTLLADGYSELRWKGQDQDAN